MIKMISRQEDFLLFYKPAGMDFHTDKAVPGFFRQVQNLYPRESLYPVHRLDKMTSGLILIARSSSSAVALGALFQQKQIQKYYLAISQKNPRKKQGLVKGDMLRSRRSSWKLTRGMSDPAISYFYSCSLAPKKRLFLFRIYTGKTHQIRVAMNSLGSPVWGDPLYNISGPDADRAYLHSWQIHFHWKGQPLVFRCDPEEGRLFRPEEGFFLPPAWECFDELSWPSF
ncbi:MAG: hypothetical protein B6241_14080 [Spirochaetaceae bacterium 4572_59]|nr:MAG: hypothetical protein B6241_14080 [Spirochaetaceae bacterium 4572_59]